MSKQLLDFVSWCGVIFKKCGEKNITTPKTRKLQEWYKEGISPQAAIERAFVAHFSLKAA